MAPHRARWPYVCWRDVVMLEPKTSPLCRPFSSSPSSLISLIFCSFVGLMLEPNTMWYPLSALPSPLSPSSFIAYSFVGLMWGPNATCFHRPFSEEWRPKGSASGILGLRRFARWSNVQCVLWFGGRWRGRQIMVDRMVRQAGKHAKQSRSVGICDCDRSKNCNVGYACSTSQLVRSKGLSWMRRLFEGALNRISTVH